MNTLHAHRPILLAPLLLALAPIADEINFHPKANTEVGKKLELEVELKVEDVSFTLNGQAMPAESLGSIQGQSILLDLAIGVSEKYVDSRDGHPLELLRTYDDVSFSAEMGDKKKEPDAPKIEGKTVRFRWNEEEQAYDKSWHESEGDAERLKALSDDMDLRLLLPPKKVAVGDTWEVSGEELLPLFLPGFHGGEIGGETLDEEGAKFFEAFRDEVGGQLEAFIKEFKVRCRYEGEREVGNERAAEIRFDFSAEPKLDLASLIERVAEMQGGDAPEADITAELGLDFKGEGSLLWDQAAGHLHSFDMQSEISIEADIDAKAEQDGQTSEIAVSLALGGKATWKMKTEKR